MNPMQKTWHGLQKSMPNGQLGCMKPNIPTPNMHTIKSLNSGQDYNASSSILDKLLMKNDNVDTDLTC